MVSSPVFAASRALALAIVGVGCMGFSGLEAPAWVKNALSLGRKDELRAAPPATRAAALSSIAVTTLRS